jgi:hypothetical protein
MITYKVIFKFLQARDQMQTTRPENFSEYFVLPAFQHLYCYQ